MPCGRSALPTAGSDPLRFSGPGTPPVVRRVRTIGTGVGPTGPPHPEHEDEERDDDGAAPDAEESGHQTGDEADPEAREDEARAARGGSLCHSTMKALSTTQAPSTSITVYCHDSSIGCGVSSGSPSRKRVS